MTDSPLLGGLIRFPINRIFQPGPSTPAVALLAEDAGERFVAIQVGPREAAALRNDIDSFPGQSAGDGRIVIDELIDGSFHSLLLGIHESGRP
jgi:hypothetical protein